MSKRWKIMGLGEVLWDCFGENRKPGGAPSNAAFQCNQLGAEGIVCSRIGADPLGDELLDLFQRLNMRTDAIQKDAHKPTGTVTVHMNANGSATYTIHEGVAWDFLEYTPALQTVARTLDAVCFGSLAQRSETTRHTIFQLLKDVPESCLKVYDVNLRQEYYSLEILENSMRVADIVKLNDEEAVVVADLLGFPIRERGVVDFCYELGVRYDLKKVCVTRGPEGCLLVQCGKTREECVVADVPGEVVPVADTVGSGDAFTAALIYTTLEGFPLEIQARFANAVGTLVATRPGGMPPLIPELSNLKAQLLR